MCGKTRSPANWSLLESLKLLLEPIEKLTPDLSAYDASLSAVIPSIYGLKVTPEGDKRDAGIKGKYYLERDAGIKTMESGLLDARFAPLMNQAVATISTALDPRFKLKFIEADKVRDEVKTRHLHLCQIYSPKLKMTLRLMHKQMNR